MNYLKLNQDGTAATTGIDIPVQKLQTVLYNQIKGLWPVTDANFNMYGRAYRNQLDTGYVPEVYIGNGEYKDSYFDDTLKGSAFFGLGEVGKATKEGDVTANVFLIFMVNLDLIKPGTNRNDEEVRIDIERLCLERNYGFFLSGIITGIDQVFKEYNIKSIKFRDMQPWHCFRLNFNITYNIYDIN
ncbi:MAG: hypothetical protein JWR05_3483 [Mucilaginibacter sp.]|nr:hypothetical protein [Mucilaginibacter sp.]